MGPRSPCKLMKIVRPAKGLQFFFRPECHWLCIGHGFSRAALRAAEREGFTGYGKTHALYQGTTLVGP